jgi:histidyl-tRNA synthetase
MGQKEAMEGSVIVRDLRTRAQETIPLDLLVSYIKTLPKKR